MMKSTIRGWLLVLAAAAFPFKAAAFSGAIATLRSAAASIPPELGFNEIFRMPIGRGGLEYTDRAKALEGRVVVVSGFMVAQCAPVPGQFMLAPMPIQLHEHEWGFAEDLPPTTVFVRVAAYSDRIVPRIAGPIRVVGRLSLGTQSEPDGRVSAVRLTLDPAFKIPEPEATVADGPTPAQGAHASCGHSH